MPRRAHRLSPMITLTLLATLTPAAALMPATPANAATLTIAKSTYYDKTLAGILGQVGGFLTGYEYASPNPYPDDHCFRPAYGPYSGDAPADCWTPNNYPGYDRHGAPHFAANEIGGDDDYHIDFFNQHILDVHGPRPSYQDIKDEWVEHDIGDFGPGHIANAAMRDDGLIPPLTGQAEYNRHYWLTESYIETETTGMVAPGMPATARDLTEMFAAVVGEFDSVVWGKFLGTLYAIAYFETDARVAMEKAAAVLPRDGWPHLVYEKAKALHGQNSTDWRWAQAQLRAFTRNVYGQDNPQAIPDINNGSLILSILYGNNSYLDTLRISSLIGNDADCTASAAAGLMGIIKGMAGTPQEFKDRIYQNGAGRYVNDLTTGFPPNIKNNYPYSQSWDDITALYQRNAEDQILAGGGSIDATNYYVNGQSVEPEAVLALNNYDFEQGSLASWTKWTPGADPGSPNAFAEDNGTAQSGQWKGTVFTDADVSEVKLRTTLRGLQPGATYRVTAFIQGNGVARLYAAGYGGPEIHTSALNTYARPNQQWVSRTLEFTATTTTAETGLHLPPGPTAFAAIDNLTVVRIDAPSATRYEAENAARTGGQVRSSTSASGGGYVGGLDAIGNGVHFSVTVPSAGQYRATVNFANATSGFSELDLVVNGNAKATIPFPRTEAWGTFSRNAIQVPLDLPAGTSTVTLRRGSDAGYVELDHLTLSTHPRPVYAPLSQNYVANGGFEQTGPSQTPAAWGTWPGTAGIHADADYTETGGQIGAHRLTHHKATAYEVYTDQTVTGLPNGTYTLTAWAVGSGGQTDAFMSVKNYATGAPELTARATGLGWPRWQRIVVSGIVVQNGQAIIGFYSNAAGGQWSSFDGVTLHRQ